MVQYSASGAKIRLCMPWSESTAIRRASGPVTSTDRFPHLNLQTAGYKSPHTASYRIPIARDASSAIMINEIADCSIVSTLAHRDSTGVSDGENAVLMLKAMNR